MQNHPKIGLFRYWTQFWDSHFWKLHDQSDIIGQWHCVYYVIVFFEPSNGRSVSEASPLLFGIPKWMASYQDDRVIVQLWIPLGLGIYLGSIYTFPMFANNFQLAQTSGLGFDPVMSWKCQTRDLPAMSARSGCFLFGIRSVWGFNQPLRCQCFWMVPRPNWDNSSPDPVGPVSLQRFESRGPSGAEFFELHLVSRLGNWWKLMISFEGMAVFTGKNKDKPLVSLGAYVQTKSIVCLVVMGIGMMILCDCTTTSQIDGSATWLLWFKIIYIYIYIYYTYHLVI